MEIKVKKIDSKAKVPDYAHPGDAGMDLYTTESYTLESGELNLFSTGIAVELPKGYSAVIKDKSSLPTKHSVHALAGVIDSGYRGEWKVPLINLGEEPVEIKQGQNIVQAVILSTPEVEIVEAEDLSDSSRGEGGFGSTGKF